MALINPVSVCSLCNIDFHTIVLTINQRARNKLVSNNYNSVYYKASIKITKLQKTTLIVIILFAMKDSFQ